MSTQWDNENKMQKLVKINESNEIYCKNGVPKEYIIYMYSWINQTISRFNFHEQYKKFLYNNSIELLDIYIKNEECASCILQLICIVAINLTLKLYDDEFRFKNTKISEYTKGLYKPIDIYRMECNMLKYCKIKFNNDENLLI